MSEYAFSRTYQIKLLALCIRRREFMASHRDVLAVEWFSDPAHKTIARVILAFFDEYGRPPTEAALIENVCNVIASDKRLAAQAEVYGAALESVLGAELYDEDDVTAKACHFARSQSMQRALADASRLLDAGDIDGIARMIDNAAMVGHNRADLGTFHFENTDRWLSSRSQQTIPTGIMPLDRVLRGGVAPTELFVFEAPPNKGKTLCLVNTGVGALKAGKAVVHVTLENQERSVGSRYDKCLLGADLANLIYPEDGSSPDLSILQDAKRELERIHAQTMSNLVYKYYPPKTASETMLKSYINTLITTGKIDVDDGLVLIVDYGMEMKPERARESTRLEIQECYQGLLRLGDYFKCPVYTAMQANRAAMRKKIIGMEDLAECFAVAASAHIIVSVNDTDETEGGYPAVDLFVARSRDTRGQSIIRMGVDIDSMRLVGNRDAEDYSDYVRRFGGAESVPDDDAVEARKNRRKNKSWLASGSVNE